MNNHDYANFLGTWQGLLATADPHTGMFKHLSQGWSRILGWSNAELFAKPFIDFVHPDDREATIEATMTLAEGNNVIQFVNRYACKDGSYKWISWSSSVDPSVDPTDRLIHAAAHDVTEHVETRQQLERTLVDVQNFRSLIEVTSDFVGMTSPDGVIRFVNCAGLEMLERSADEVMGASIQIMHPPAYLQHLVEVGVPHALEHGTWSGEGELVRADGRTRAISQVIVRISDTTGAVHGLGTIVRDISRAKQLETELRTQTERLIEGLQALSTPFIPITRDIVVMPLIGQMDTMRAEQVMEVALNGVASTGVRVVILDLTGLTVVDTMVASSLVGTARSLRLLGTETILTGIQPAVAQTLVGLGLDLGDTKTHATLQSAIAMALRGSNTDTD